MLESLTINGRTYVPADTAAAEVGYAASYIERLARGKWIDASFVHDRCFVDIDSVRAFITSSESDVVTQTSYAALREKTETMLHLYELRTGEVPAPTHVWFMIGQVGVITACGLLVGVLSFSALRAELTIQDFAHGLGETASVLQQQVALPATVLLHSLFYTDSIGSLEESSDVNPQPVPVSDNTSNGDVHKVFSDEVLVEGEMNGQAIIRPVYKAGPAAETILY